MAVVCDRSLHHRASLDRVAVEGVVIGRRGFITGLVSFIAAPAIVRAGSLMPVRTMIEPPLYGISPAMQALGLFEREFGKAMFDLGAFGTSIIQVGPDGVRHVDLREVLP